MVNWTVKALRHLRRVLAEPLGRAAQEPETKAAPLRGCTGVLDAKMDQLNEILQNTFPDATSVVVQDHLMGYRQKKHSYVLLVEVFSPSTPGPYVVKIGPVEELEKEIDGWECCRPVGLHHDLVFLPATEGYRQKDGPEPRLMSLVYGDAQQFVGVETTSTFEAAVLQAVRFGKPTVQSVAFVLVELFERIGHLLYSQSFVDEPTDDGFVFDSRHLEESMRVWEQNPHVRSIRTAANVLVNHGVSEFLDPVDYLRYVHAHVPWTTPEGKTRLPELHDAPEGALPRPRVTQLVPRMLRGASHGDLHGRNILVGIVGDSVLWPTVFDYEDMSPCNLLGWDFVKLETELKIRAFSEIFYRQEGHFINDVRDFEIALNEQTEKYHQDRSWPTVQEQSQPEDRLRALLVELRRMAAVQLGINRGRPNQWLEEYYFLLAWYGVCTARFGNLEHRELLAAYVSAGVAVARLSWPRDRARKEMAMLGL